MEKSAQCFTEDCLDLVIGVHGPEEGHRFRAIKEVLGIIREETAFMGLREVIIPIDNSAIGRNIRAMDDFLDEINRHL